MEKTAVEFLDERYTYIKWMRDRDEISPTTALEWYQSAFEEAKQMEVEQIEKKIQESRFKDNQKNLIIQIMEDDEKDGLYDYPELDGTLNLCEEIINKRDDEEIEKQSWKYNPVQKLDAEFIRAAFVSGAKWYKEKNKLK